MSPHPANTMRATFHQEGAREVVTVYLGDEAVANRKVRGRPARHVRRYESRHTGTTAGPKVCFSFHERRTARDTVRLQDWMLTHSADAEEVEGHTPEELRLSAPPSSGTGWAMSRHRTNVPLTHLARHEIVHLLDQLEVAGGVLERHGLFLLLHHREAEANAGTIFDVKVYGGVEVTDIAEAVIPAELAGILTGLTFGLELSIQTVTTP